MRKKEILARTLDALLPGGVFYGCKYAIWNNLMVLAYHRVIDVNKPSDFQYDMDLVSASIKQFDYQMSYISRYLDPISENDLISHLYSGTALPRRSILVTFDDGFDDNYYNAYPILKKYSVPATMFISTQYIDGHKPIWFDWLASLFMAGNVTVIEIPALSARYIRGHHDENRRHFHDLIIKLRAIDNTIRLKIIAELEKNYTESMLHINSGNSHFMSWDQVVEMSNSSIIDIGSHTVTHPILSRLTSQEIDYEVSESKTIIEQKINKTVNSLSYPTGMKSSFTDDVVKLVKKHQYKIAFTYQHDCNSLPINDPFRMHRLHVENHVTNQYFNSMLKFPMIFAD